MESLGGFLLGPQGPEMGIYQGDARWLSQKIPEESIDLILTDPPYLHDTLWSFEFLTELGARVLRPGGFLFAYCGAEFLPDGLGALGRKLRYFWTFALLHRRGTPKMWSKRLFSAYKPILAFSKGAPRRHGWARTVMKDSRDKRFHRWGQGVEFPAGILEIYSEKGEIVLDPFCGGGTVPLACYMLGRRWLAFEIDPEVTERARARVKAAVPAHQLGLEALGEPFSLVRLVP